MNLQYKGLERQLNIRVRRGRELRHDRDPKCKSMRDWSSLHDLLLASALSVQIRPAVTSQVLGKLEERLCFTMQGSVGMPAVGLAIPFRFVSVLHTQQRQGAAPQRSTHGRFGPWCWVIWNSKCVTFRNILRLPVCYFHWRFKCMGCQRHKKCVQVVPEGRLDICMYYIYILTYAQS